MMNNIDVDGEGVGSTALVATRFVWPLGGRHVHLCGSFTRWRESLPMSPVDGAPQLFSVVCSLPPGYHQYKFIVDSEWRHDENQPYMPDPLGNVNNWCLVRDPIPQDTPAALAAAAAAHPPSPHPPPSPLDPPPPPPSTRDSMDSEPMEVSHPTLPPTLPQPHPQPQLHPAPAPPPPLLLLSPSLGLSASDTQSSKQRIVEFLASNAAHQLLPESGKVVALDVALPIKQAFHALYEQGVPSAPLWDSDSCQYVGMLSASDFITILTQLRSSGLSVTEEEVESHTIAEWKEAKGRDKQPRRPLIKAGPDDSLRSVADLLLRSGVASIPILAVTTPPGTPPLLLHLASLAGILKCIGRHFRHVAASLPLLAAPVGSLALGTWAAHTHKEGGGKHRDLAVLRETDSLNTALAMLLEVNVSSLPVVDHAGGLVDLYARSDITALARERKYARMQDNMTVSEALRSCQNGSSPQGVAPAARCHMCLQSDPLRSVVERLAMPGVRRLICVEAGSKRVEGIISLTDIFNFLFGA